MAEDWIKVELSLPDKEEVVAMAAALQIDQDAVTGKLMRFWAWCSRNTPDPATVECYALRVTQSFIDRLTACPGFAATLMKVAWLAGEDMALTIPNFERHNGSTAKSRACASRRVANMRARNANVTPAPLHKPLPDRDEDEDRESIVNLNDSRALIPGLTGAENGPETFHVEPPDDFDAGQLDLWRQLCVEMGYGCRKSRLGFIKYRPYWAKAIRDRPFAVYEGISACHTQRDTKGPSSFPGKLIQHITDQEPPQQLSA